MRKPNANVNALSTLPEVVPQVWDVLQVESQGVLLVQMADVILGSSLYAGNAIPKLQLAERVAQIRRKLAKPRFEEWRVRWDE